LNYISPTLRRRTNAGNELFEFTAYAPPEGRVSLNVWIKGYAKFLPDGEYRFDGDCPSFPFEAIQKIVREYDIPTWNGWNKVVDGRYEEWIQMELGYAGGEGISIMGSLFPESYDAARDAILQSAAEFIKANSEDFI